MKNYSQPNTLGRFGEYGGMYVSETLMPLLIDLDQSYQKIQKDKKFQKELEDLFKNYVGRPSALHHAKNLSAYLNGPKIYFKRDELNHTGAHKINNCLGQILLAKKNGQNQNYSRNWGWPAWSCYGYCLCTVWTALLYLHGLKRY